MHLNALRLSAVLVAGVILLASCGGGGDSSSFDAAEIASLETTAPAEQAADSDVTAPEDEDGATDNAEQPLTFEDAQFAFSQCMRDNGYGEWPDPDPNATGQGGGRAGFGGVDFAELGIDPQSGEFQSAIETCRESFDGVAGGRQDLTPEQQAELEDNLLAMFACIRENPGYEDLPDPDFTGDNGFGLRQLFQTGDFDPQEFRGLLQDCQQDLGIEGGFGGGPGAGRRPPQPAANANA